MVVVAEAKGSLEGENDGCDALVLDFLDEAGEVDAWEAEGFFVVGGEEPVPVAGDDVARFEHFNRGLDIIRPILATDGAKTDDVGLDSLHFFFNEVGRVYVEDFGSSHFYVPVEDLSVSEFTVSRGPIGGLRDDAGERDSSAIYFAV